MPLRAANQSGRRNSCVAASDRIGFYRHLFSVDSECGHRLPPFALRDRAKLCRFARRINPAGETPASQHPIGSAFTDTFFPLTVNAAIAFLRSRCGTGLSYAASRGESIRPEKLLRRSIRSDRLLPTPFFR